MAGNLPDFEAMTLDEIDAWKVEKKAQIAALQDEYNAAHEVRSRKVAELHLEEASFQLSRAAEASGRSLADQAWYWLNEENAEDDGHRHQAGLWLRANTKVGE